MKKNVASQVVGAEMITAADGSAFTGSVSVAVTVDAGTQGAGGGTAPAHEGNGFHSYTPTQAETNGDHVAFTFTGSGAIPCTVQVYTTFPQTGDTFALMGTPAADVSADIAAVKAETALIVADTGELQTNQGNWLTLTGAATSAALATAQTDLDTLTGTDGATLATAQANYAPATSAAMSTAQSDLDTLTGTDGATLATTQANYAPSTAAAVAALNDISVADVLTTQMTEAYNADGAAPTLAQALHLIIAYLTERSVTGTTVTAKKLDGSTTAATFTLNDGTTPTSVTRAT